MWAAAGQTTSSIHAFLPLGTLPFACAGGCAACCGCCGCCSGCCVSQSVCQILMVPSSEPDAYSLPSGPNLHTPTFGHDTAAKNTRDGWLVTVCWLCQATRTYVCRTRCFTPCPQDQTCTASKQIQSVMKLSTALHSIAAKAGTVHQGSSALKANITTAEGSMGPGLAIGGADRMHVCVQQTPVTWFFTSASCDPLVLLPQAGLEVLIHDAVWLNLYHPRHSGVRAP